MFELHWSILEATPELRVEASLVVGKTFWSLASLVTLVEHSGRGGEASRLDAC